MTSSPEKAFDSACCILVADDDPLSRTALRIQLDYIGYRADLAKDGKEVLAAIAQKAYQLLIIDMHMGKTDGLSTTLAIRQVLPAEKQPFIAILTGGVTAAEYEALHAAGIDAFLEKPVSIYNLEELLARACTPVLAACQGVSLPVPTLPKSEELVQVQATQRGSIDFQILHELLKINHQPEGRMTADFLALFFQTAPGLMQKIKEAAQNRRLPELKGALHALRSSSEIYGAYRLCQLCKTLENEIDQGVVKTSSDQIVGIEAEFIRVAEILRIYQTTQPELRHGENLT